MKNLTHYQNNILNKLYGPLEKTDPLRELLRICKFYNDILKNENDEIILFSFKKMVEAKLSFVLPADFRFYQLEQYKEKYKEQLQDFLEDTPDSKEVDFILNCISEQNKIIENTFIYEIEMSNEPPFEVMRFVDKNFLDDFKSSSKRKVEFLNNRLKEFSEIGIVTVITDYENPYPLLFISGKVYQQFIEYTSKYIIDFYIDYSYLKKRMEDDGLIHRIKDNDFMNILFNEMRLISERKFNLYDEKNKLSSLKKSSSTNRQNNFNLVFNL
jgi:hypothetical protein